MKFRAIIVVSLFVLSSRLPAPDAAGHGGGTTGDLDTPFGTSKTLGPWFEGKSKEIRYCYEVSKSFGLPHATLINGIENAFKVWREYLNKKKLDEDIATTIKYIGTCDGSEDLKFYFGVTNDEVKGATTAYCSDIAFAYPTKYQRLTPYAVERTWAKGFIWIADTNSLSRKMPYPEGSAHSEHMPGFPVWGVSDLSGILIHEIGHVFGNAHAERTIMEPAIGRWIWHYQDPKLFHFPESKKALEAKFRSIDWEWEYAKCHELLKRVYVGPLYDPMIPGHEHSHSQELFETLTGRKLKGHARVRLIRDSDRTEIFLEDYAGSHQLPLGPHGGQRALRSWYAFGRLRQNSTTGLYPFGVAIKDPRTGASGVFLQVRENIRHAIEIDVVYSDARTKTLAELSGKSAQCEPH